MKTIYNKLNDTNEADFAAKTNGSFRRQIDIDLTYNNLNNVNWKSEADYYNATYVNGTWNKGRTIIKKK